MGPGCAPAELVGLDADAVVRIGAGHWLRTPLGKLRNDRYVPLHPELVELLAAWPGWLSGNQKQALSESFAAFVGHPAYTTGTLCADLHRFAFLLGASDGEELFGEPAP